MAIHRGQYLREIRRNNVKIDKTVVGQDRKLAVKVERISGTNVERDSGYRVGIPIRRSKATLALSQPSGGRIQGNS